MSVACRSRVDRVMIDIWIDASVDVSVVAPYKIHDPKVVRWRMGSWVAKSCFETIHLNSPKRVQRIYLLLVVPCPSRIVPKIT